MITKKSNSDTPRLFTIIEELTDGFCTIDKSGDLIYLNLAAIDLLKIDDKHNYNFFSDIITDQATIKYINDFLRDHDFIKDFEVTLSAKDDTKFPALVSINKIKDPGNNIIGMSVLIKDMTYIKQVQQQLFQAQKMESIGMLASGVAHEFNNILTGIIPNAELIKLTTSHEEANYTRAESIQKSASRASEIVKKLLNFAREDSAIKDEATDFVKTAGDTIDILKRLFDRKIDFEFHHDEKLYNARIDDTSIQQIIMNLSINAKDAIVGKGIIRLTAKNVLIEDGQNMHPGKLPPGKYIKFDLSDTGQGIDRDKMKLIFDPFYTTKAPGKGTGLGLSMVYGIIKGCNGWIDVDSEPGSGTTFSIYIPATEKTEKKEVSEYRNYNIGSGHTILVVDDEEIIAEMATDMLQALGFNVLTAINGVEALELYNKHIQSIDMVLLDLLMPEMDGITCYENLKLINPGVKVIISSGIGEQAKKTELLELGVQGYLEKPYSMKSMSKELEKII